MSKYIERFTMTVSTGNWEKLMEIEKKFTVCEDNLGGIPRKKWLQPFSSPHTLNSVQWEREWNSLAEMEEAGEKMKNSSEHQEIINAFMSSGVANSFHRELLQIQNPLS
tara:strand:+ start:196 stop:522 length:327 start_codon:yes stop_codon:yes gene_type:complete